ncbi:MAG: hypothetical protein HYX33_01015 [Actinobacteria bacterium]|nr:hypothetical protein [Actinomycetota bacterium]
MPALIAAAEARALGVVALVVAGDLTAVAAAAAGCETAVHVVLGQSIRTGDGRLTALFLTHEIPAGRSLRETIALAAAQGGFVVAPHPDDPDAPDPAELFEAGRAIDAFALVRPERGRAGDETARVARAAGIRVVGGSGARRPTDVGRVCLALPPFRDADGLRGALRDARIVRRRRPVLTARTAVQRRGRHD